MIAIESIDRAEALRYLACHDEEAIGDTAAGYLERCEKLVLEALQPRYVYRYFPLSFSGGKPVAAGCGLSLDGNDIARHLDGCSGVIIAAATAGSQTDALIRRLQVEDMALAVIADACAGAAAEQIMNEAERLIKKDFPGKYFTWRFSPGYGDFPLELQKSLLDVLQAQKKIGLCVDGGGLLVPIKSITAFIGVSESQLEQKRRGCLCCNMRERCQYRKRGAHCGF